MFLIIYKEKKNIFLNKKKSFILKIKLKNKKKINIIKKNKIILYYK